MAGLPLVNTMKAAVQKAGRAVARDFGEVENIQGNAEKVKIFMNHTKENAFKVLTDELTKSREGFGCLSSLGEEKGKGSEKWLIDIIGGEENFSRAIPQWSISLALENDGEIVAGVVYDIIRNETYFAQKGYGAFVNDRRLKVHDVKEFEDAVVFASFDASSCGAPKTRLLEGSKLYDQCVKTIRNMGSISLDIVYVAAGKGELCFSNATKSYEVAAAGIIAKEAGLFVSTLQGKKDFVYGETLLIAPSSLHAKALKLFKN